MYNYYALPLLGETAETCTVVARLKDGVFERYNPKNKSWVEDAELFQIYTGDMNFEGITEKQANIIIDRLG